MKVKDIHNEPVEINEGDICFVNLTGKTKKGKILEAQNLVFSRYYGTETRSSLTSEKREDRRLLKHFGRGKEKELEIVQIVVMKKTGKIIRRIL